MMVANRLSLTLFTISYQLWFTCTDIGDDLKMLLTLESNKDTDI